MRKDIESGYDRTEVTVDTLISEEKVKKSNNLWENFGYFGTESCDFSIEKANLPKNSIFYIKMWMPFYLLSITTMNNCFGQEVKEHLAINLPFLIRLFI